MREPRRNLLRHLARIAALLALGAACDGRFGCLACGSAFDYPSPAPEGGAIQENVLLAHVQERAVRFVAAHLSDVLRAQLPTRSAWGTERAIIYLPEAQLGGSFVTLTVRDGCIGPEPAESCPARLDPSDASYGPSYRSKLELNLDTIDDAVDVSFLPASGSTKDRVRVVLYDVDIFVDMALVMETSGTDATCVLRDERPDEAAIHLEQLAFTVSLAVDAAHRFSGEVSDVDIELGFFDDASLFNFEVAPCNGGTCTDPTCTDGWTDFECPALCALGEFVFTAAELVTNVLSPVLEWVAPPLVELAMQEVLEDVNGRPLAMSGRYDVAELFDSPGLDALLVEPTEVRFGGLPNDDAFEVSGPVGGRGMGLYLDAGTLATQSRCVPTVSPPAYGPLLGLPPFFDGKLTLRDPVTGASRVETYHVALSVSNAALAQAGFALYQLGLLCLVLTPEQMARATDGALVPTLGTLALFAPSLASLGDASAPALFVVHPTAPPLITLGSGEPTGLDASGNPMIDSHLKVDFGEVGLSIWVQLADAEVRLATVAADVAAEMALVRTPNNTLELGLKELRVENLVQVYNEVAEETDFADVAEVVLSIAVGTLMQKVSGFNLDLAPFVSDMLGGAPIYARINAVRREGEAADGYLTAYVTFCDDDDLQDPTAGPCYTPPASSVASLPPRLVRATPGASAGQVTLSVDPERRYQFRVDSGAWSDLRAAPSGRLVIVHPLLRFAGTHRIELRSQPGDDYLSMRAEPALEVHVR